MNVNGFLLCGGWGKAFWKYSAGQVSFVIQHHHDRALAPLKTA
jgi:hypothetical protein